ncbi:MAG: hypothetical protein KDB60_03350 [Propionibacteriaceae bacterium]|nr:hypothetical protein [Propionibacteriaceae bacterium]
MDSGADGDSLNKVMLARTTGEPIRFHGLEQELAGDAFEMALEEFLALDRGYLELRLSGQDYPRLTMGVRQPTRCDRLLPFTRPDGTVVRRRVKGG